MQTKTRTLEVFGLARWLHNGTTCDAPTEVSSGRFAHLTFIYVTVIQRPMARVVNIYKPDFLIINSIFTIASQLAKIDSDKLPNDNLTF